MRLTTWNVNGIRNPFSYPPWNNARTFPAMFDILGSDIVVMQELKIQRKDLSDDMVLIGGWDAYFSLPKHKKGYSGVGIYTRNATCAPIRAEEGLLGVLPSPSGVPYCDLPEGQSIGGYPTAVQLAELGVDPVALDAEGRCVAVEFPAFVLFGIYAPANSNGLRDDFRYGFIQAMDCRIRNLIRSGKRVVLVGDLNVSRDELDTASATEDCRKSGITHEEYVSTPNRRVFNQLLVDGEVIGERDEGREEGVLWDTTRGFHPTRKAMFTHWETKVNARPGNFGSRIDFVLVTGSMRSWMKDANIQEGLLGSDHCPVFADFHDTVNIDDVETSLVDIMNPPGVFEQGERKVEWKVTSVPSFSARKMPEFDRRRSIKAMFCAPTAKRLNSEASADDQTGSTMSTEPADYSNTNISLPATDDNVAAVCAMPLSKCKSPEVCKDKPIKRVRLEQRSSNGKAQRSLKGFFHTQEKSQCDVPSPTSEANDVEQNVIGVQKTKSPLKQHMSCASSSLHGHQSTAPTDSAQLSQVSEATSPPQSAAVPIPSRSPSPSQITAQIAACEKTQRSWGTLFAKPVAPLCEGHSEPCKTMQTKKKGSNQGRSFWMCARPLGPSGEKEKGTAWRCGTFIWCSDWSARKESAEQE